jgi:Domain of unknown function (DUF4345)
MHPMWPPPAREPGPRYPIRRPGSAVYNRVVRDAGTQRSGEKGMMRSSTSFLTCLRVLSLAFFGAGGLHVVLGLEADMLLGANVSASSRTDAGLDSQNRFYGAIFMLYGVLLIIVASDMQRYALVLTSTMWVLFAAGLARLISVWLYGWPSAPIVLLLVTELVAPPLVLLWFARVKHTT